MKVKTRMILMVTVLFSLVSSCAVISFYPLYTEDVLIRNDKIIGKWLSKSDSIVWEIKFDEKKWKEKKNEGVHVGGKHVPNKFTYSLYVYETKRPNKKTEYSLHLVELDGKMYFDFFPESWETTEDGLLNAHLIEVHTFAKTEISKDSIQIKWYDIDWFEKQLIKNKIRMKYEKNSRNILITAQPKELQKFVIKYSDDENAFDKDFIVTLVPMK